VTVARVLPVLAAAALALVSGCSVLTVDVDVYKGPLANNRDVLVQQVATMAIGAKPLLFDLRFKAEKDACIRDVKQSYAQAKPAEVDKCLGVLATRIDARIDMNETRLRSVHAQKVNLILGLYYDLVPAGVENPELRKGLERLYRSASDAMSKMDKATKVRDDLIGAGNPVMLSEMQRGHLQKLFSSDAERELNGWKNRDPELKGAVEKAAKESPRVGSFNRFTFALLDLAVREKVEGIDKKIEPLYEATKEAVAASGEAWSAALEILSSQPLRAKIAAGTADERALMRCAEIAAQVTSPEQLRQVSTTGSGADALAVLAQRLGMDGQRPIAPADYPIYRRRLAAALMEPDGAGFATRLLATQGNLRSGNRPTPVGLLTFPLPSPALGKTVASELRESLALLTQALASSLGALEGGRAWEGIDRLIQNYLEVHRRDPANGKADSAAAVAEDQLLDALVNFAEKVTVMGDNEVLLQDPTTGNDAGSTLDKRSADRYVRVLQAIGNSILVQVDEIKKSSDSRRALSDPDQARRHQQRFARAEATTYKATLDDIARQIGTSNVQQARRDQLKTAVENGAKNVKTASDALKTERAQHEKDLEAAKRTVSRAQAARTCLGRSDLADALKGTSGTVSRDAASQAIGKALTDLASRATTDNKPEDSAALTTCAEAINDVWNKPPYPDSATLAEYLVHLRGSLDTAAREGQKEVDRLALLLTDFERWQAALSEPTASARVRLGDFTARNVTDTYDELLGMLSDLRVLEVANNGDTAYARQLEKAWNLAYASRATMTYLRPASAYLRNSYPASVLQSDPSTARRNMLMDTFLQSLPFTGPDTEDIKTQRAIDKQFWQSVNRVRVSGSGRTNYVVAKDDVGNWYVKGYSNNVEDIVKSMKNLAVFSIGPAARATLVPAPTANPEQSATPAGTSGTSPATPSPASAAPPPASGSPELGKQIDRFSQRYEQHTQEQYKQLVDDARDLKVSVVKEAQGPVGDGSLRDRIAALLADLPAPDSDENRLKPHVTADPKAAKTVDQAAADIVALLAAMHSYYQAAREKLRGKTADGESLPDETHSAAATAMAMADERRREAVIGKRQESIARLEEALRVLGDLPAP
jgi:hypothetical protein